MGGHALRPHSDGVASRRAADRLRLGANGLELSNRTVDERLDARVAWIHRRMQIEHANNRLVPVTILKVDGTEHRASWRTGVTVGDDVRASVECLIQFQLLCFVSSGLIFHSDRGGQYP